MKQIVGMRYPSYECREEGNQIRGHSEVSFQLSMDRVTRMMSGIFKMPSLFITSENVTELRIASACGLVEELEGLQEVESKAIICEQLFSFHNSSDVHNDSIETGLLDQKVVKLPSGVIFYAGTALVNCCGNKVGVLAVISRHPGELAQQDNRLLLEFAELIRTQLEYKAEIELRVSELLLKNSEERYKTLVEHSPVMIHVHDKKNLLYINSAGTDLLGANGQEDLIGKSILDVVHPDNWMAVKQQYVDLLEGHDIPSFEQKYVTFDGKILEVEVKARPIVFEGKNAILAVSRDVTKQRLKERKMLKAHKQLMEIATVDGLTGVSNRRMMGDFLISEWSRSIRNSTPISLIMLDVDYFKLYNDTYGHLIGDECLITVAQAIKGSLIRSSDFLARYGGEEFAIILPETDSEGALYVAERIRKQVEMLAIAHDQSEISGGITVSLGVSTLMGNVDNDFTQLIETADKALYVSKRNGRNQVSCYIKD